MCYYCNPMCDNCRPKLIRCPACSKINYFDETRCSYCGSQITGEMRSAWNERWEAGDRLGSANRKPRFIDDDEDED